MDVRFFLCERTRFVRHFYETAGEPFCETIRKIETHEDPFVPGPSDDGEPPFLQEWLDADTSLQMLGRACLSMVSAALKLYFQTWESELHIKWEPGEKKRYFKHGFVRGYQQCFGELLRLDWRECPADFDLLEQITLARNADQHPEHIADLHHTHDRETRARFPSPFFIRDSERYMVSLDNPLSDWFAPAIHVPHDKLLAAINQVEGLAEWLEPRMLSAKYG